MALWDAQGRRVVVDGMQGERATLRAPFSAPPGAPLCLTLAADEGAGAAAGGRTSVEMRVLGCRRQGEGFVLQVRFVSLRRAVRERLQTGGA
ncbi:MAG: hypothetical protein ACPGUV_12985 [Polyangiales bacterium]